MDRESPWKLAALSGHKLREQLQTGSWAATFTITLEKEILLIKANQESWCHVYLWSRCSLPLSFFTQARHFLFSFSLHPSKWVNWMCGQQNLQMSPNHLRTSGRPDNISWDSWVTRHRHLCRLFQMVIPCCDLLKLDSNDCIIIVPSPWGLHTVGKNNCQSHRGFGSTGTIFRTFQCTQPPTVATRMKHCFPFI